jgi:uncharacterized protein
MKVDERTRCTAFEGFRRIASGDLPHVALAIKGIVDRGNPILIFDDASGEQVEVDLRGTQEDVRKRLAREVAPERQLQERPRGPGRPRIGVVAREVTLLPRHWEWLNSQPGGASVTLRKLVEEARRANQGRDHARRAQEATYRFMSAMAGNLPAFEEAARALFAYDPERFAQQIRGWPRDLQRYLVRLVSGAMRIKLEKKPRATRPAKKKGAKRRWRLNSRS